MKPSLLPNGRFKTTALLSAAAMCLVFGQCVAKNKQPLSQLSTIKQGELLGWKPKPGKGFCSGSFEALSFKTKDKTAKHQFHLQSDAPIVLRPHGQSEITGPVVISQPGRRLSANHATIMRDKHGQITQVRLDRGVRVDGAHERFMADHVVVQLDQKHHEATEVLYRIAARHHLGLSAWGSAERVLILDPQHFEIVQGNYSTCPPGSHGWRLHSSDILINQKSGRGEAWHSWITIGKIPIFYSPYINFPIDKRRKSGLLIPSFSQSSVDGTSIGVPVYWNIAPNMDATFTPLWIEHRGTLFQNNMRYLQHHGRGRLDFNIMGHDDRFATFKSSAASTFGRNSNTIPYLNALSGDTDTRYFMQWQDQHQWGRHWRSDISGQHVSDDYFLQDFTVSGLDSNNTQIPSHANFNYESDNWGAALSWMFYQNLHTINRTKVTEPYDRLPSFSVNGDVPLSSRMPFTMQYNANIIRFERSADFITDQKSTTGTRLFAQPQLSTNLLLSPIKVSTTVIANQINYQLNNQGALPESPHLFVPQYRMDIISYLFKPVHLLGQHYLNTLEPHIAYLYTPFKNQNDLPVFDSDLPTFTTDQVFANNRFSGDDRVGDSNQISLGLTTSLLTQDSHEERLRMVIGSIVYLANRQVCLNADCSKAENRLNSRHLSPIAASVQYQMPHHWTINSQFAYEPHQQHMENTQLTFDYQRDRYHLLTLGYEFDQDGDPNPKDSQGQSSNLSKVRTSVYWPLGHGHWQGIGSWYYNISHRTLDTGLLGFEYNDCCWALRVLFSRHLTVENSITSKSHENKVSLVLNLKGLSSVSMHNPSSLLNQAFSGHFDNHLGD